jgi:hypothetical protein
MGGMDQRGEVIMVAKKDKTNLFNKTKLSLKTKKQNRIPKSLTEDQKEYLKLLKYENKPKFSDRQGWDVSTMDEANAITNVMQKKGYSVTIKDEMRYGFRHIYIAAVRGK